MCKKHKVRILLEQFWRLQQITAKARKHTWYFYQVVRKTSLQSVQETQSSLSFGIILVPLDTNHGKARKHIWYFYKVVRKTSLQSVQETQSSLSFGIILVPLATNHGKSSQKHLVFLPSSSKDLTAKCARNLKFASYHAKLHLTTETAWTDF